MDPSATLLTSSFQLGRIKNIRYILCNTYVPKTYFLCTMYYKLNGKTSPVNNVVIQTFNWIPLQNFLIQLFRLVYVVHCCTMEIRTSKCSILNLNTCLIILFLHYNDYIHVWLCSKNILGRILWHLFVHRGIWGIYSLNLLHNQSKICKLRSWSRSVSNDISIMNILHFLEQLVLVFFSSSLGWICFLYPDSTFQWVFVSKDYKNMFDDHTKLQQHWLDERGG